MEEEVLEGEADPILEEEASNLQVEEAFHREAFLEEEEASFQGVEGLLHVHAALEGNLQEASEVLLLPLEAEEGAWEALGEILEVRAAWEAYLQEEERVEEAFQGSLDGLHDAYLEAEVQEQSLRWGLEERRRTVDGVCPLGREGSVQRGDAPRRSHGAHPCCPS